MGKFLSISGVRICQYYKISNKQSNKTLRKCVVCLFIDFSEFFSQQKDSHCIDQLPCLPKIVTLLNTINRYLCKTANEFDVTNDLSSNQTLLLRFHAKQALSNNFHINKKCHNHWYKNYRKICFDLKFAFLSLSITFVKSYKKSVQMFFFFLKKFISLVQLSQTHIRHKH